jgi:ribosomal protein S21
MDVINKKCFLVKVIVKENNFFREALREVKRKEKKEELYGEIINYSFVEEGNLIKCKEYFRLIVDKQFYSKSLEDVKSEVNELVREDINKSLDSFLKKWELSSGEKGRSKEDLISIYDNSIDNYDIEIEELNYIVLENDSLADFTKLVNEHLKFGWKVLGGMQLSIASGGESPYNWSNKNYLQSLTNSQSCSL